MSLPKYSQAPTIWIIIQSMYIIHYLSTIYILITSNNEYIFYHRLIFIAQHLLIFYIFIAYYLKWKIQFIPFEPNDDNLCLESTVTFSIIILSNSMGFFCNFQLMKNYTVIITNIVAVIYVTILVYQGIKDEFLSPFDKPFEFQSKWFPNSIKWWFITQIIKTIFMICIWTEMLYNSNNYYFKFILLLIFSTINIIITILHDPFLMQYITFMFHEENICHFQLIQKKNLSENQLLIHSFCIINDKYITIQTCDEYWRYIIKFIKMTNYQKLYHINKLCGYNDNYYYLICGGYTITNIIIILFIILDILTPIILLILSVDYRFEHMFILTLLHFGGVLLFGWYGFIKEKCIPSRLQSILQRDIYYGLRQHHCRIGLWLKKPKINNIIKDINCVQTIIHSNYIYGITKDVLLIIITYLFEQHHCNQCLQQY